MDFVSGDGVNVTISGATPGGTVTLVETKNGSPYCPCPWTAGTIDGSGNFTLTGTEMDIHVAEYTEQWYVNGVAVGGLLDFEVVYKPTTVTPTAVNLTSFPSACSGLTYGIWIDITYQTKNSSGFNVTSQTGIPFEPTELVSFDGGGLVGGDLGPVAGYSTSSQYTTTGGVFHDVPLGECANYTFSGETIAQTLYIDIGDNSYQVRQQTFNISSSSNNHGYITNSSDVSATR